MNPWQQTAAFASQLSSLAYEMDLFGKARQALPDMLSTMQPLNGWTKADLDFLEIVNLSWKLCFIQESHQTEIEVTLTLWYGSEEVGYFDASFDLNGELSSSTLKFHISRE